MLIDARTVAADSVVRGDLCIIGAGAAGISIAWALRDHPVRVVLLESGSFWPSAATQALYRGRNVGRGYFPLDGCRVRTFGGSTQRWGGWCRSLDPSDFEPRPWLPGSGWPMTRDDLGRYYRQAREMCQLAVTEGEIDHGPPLPYRPRFPGTHPALATVVYQFSPPTRFGPTYRDGLERAKNIDGYLWANVVELLGGEHGGPVTGARVRTLAGTTFRVEATRFVLATGGVENARLLLASNNTRPGGLGNENDLVGRFFMEHLHVRLGCFVPARPDANLSFYTQGRRSVRRPLGGLTVAPAARPTHGVYGFSAVFFTPRHRTVAKVLYKQAQRQDQWALHGVSIAQGGAMGFGMRVLDKLARDTQEASARLNFAVPQRRGDRIYEIMGRGEQSPNRESRVTIGRDLDRLGMPVCELDWRVRRADLTNIRTSLETIGGALAAIGAGRLHLPTDPDMAWAQRIVGSWHHMGTTRMHADPREGVVDADCRVHTVPNLYIAGSSVFATGGYANPTLTIVALALRLADHLAGRVTGAPPL
ncbi:MAG: FAD-dependent oxidoreductase [Gemmatimonadales bacterium]